MASGSTSSPLAAGAAHYRKTAAGLIQRFPELVEPLRDGRLCLTSICELARVITAENRSEVLPRFFHASKQEAKAVAAELSPREAVPHRAVATAVGPVVHAPVACAAPALALGQSFHPDETPPVPYAVQPAALTPTKTPPPSPMPALRSTTEPLTADLRRLHVTVAKRFLAKLDAARAALSHSHPGADVVAILEAGLDLVFERHAKRKGIVASPRTPPPQSGSAFRRDPLPQRLGGEGTEPIAIPAAVRREVWVRDGGRCQWPVDGGGICGSTLRVEFDHVVPRARRGGSTVSNLRLCCRVHNQLAARRVFGDALMDGFARSRSPAPAPPFTPMSEGVASPELRGAGNAR